MEKNIYKIGKELFITNDEEIKKGDWFIQTTYEGVFKCSDVKAEYIHFDGDSYEPLKYCKKIILTTDQDLIKDGVQAIDDEFLEWFVKNPNCEEIEVVDVRSLGVYGSYYPYKINIPKKETKQETFEEAAKDFVENTMKFSFTSIDTKTQANRMLKCVEFGVKWQQEQEKITTDDAYNEGFENGKHWQQEKSYSEEDLREAFKSGGKMSWTDINQETQEPYYYDFNEWFKQFKKK